MKKELNVVGKWFHSIKDGKVNWQGQLLERSGESYRAQLYSWLTGEPTDIVVIAKKDLQIWPIYDTNIDMRMYAEFRRETEQ